jgi:hypothetical protein
MYPHSALQQRKKKKERIIKFQEDIHCVFLCAQNFDGNVQSYLSYKEYFRKQIAK